MEHSFTPGLNLVPARTVPEYESTELQFITRLYCTHNSEIEIAQHVKEGKAVFIDVQ